MWPEAPNPERFHRQRTYMIHTEDPDSRNALSIAARTRGVEAWHEYGCALASIIEGSIGIVPIPSKNGLLYIDRGLPETLGHAEPTRRPTEIVDRSVGETVLGTTIKLSNSWIITITDNEAVALSKFRAHRLGLKALFSLFHYLANWHQPVIPAKVGIHKHAPRPNAQDMQVK